MKLLINTFKDFKAIVKESRKVTLPFISIGNKFQSGYTNLNNEFVKDKTGLPSSIPGIIVTRFSNMLGQSNTYTIANEAFFKMPKNIQKAIELHELGHVMNGDLDDIPKETNNLTQEINADVYSLQHGGDLIEAHNYMMHNHPLLVSHDNFYLKRIEYFRNIGYSIDNKAYLYCKLLSKVV